MFQFSDFRRVSSKKVVYLGKSYHFDHPKSLSRWDIACALNELQPECHWNIIYDVFDKSYLVHTLMLTLLNKS